MKSLTSSDRKALIRLASALPKGSDERRAILSGLKKVAAGKWRMYAAQLRSPGEKMSGKPVFLMEGSRQDLGKFEREIDELFKISDGRVSEDGTFGQQGGVRTLSPSLKQWIGDPKGAKKEMDSRMKGKGKGWHLVELPPESDRRPVDKADSDSWPSNEFYGSLVLDWPTDENGLPKTV